MAPRASAGRSTSSCPAGSRPSRRRTRDEPRGPQRRRRPHPLLPAVHLPGVPAPLQVRADVLGIRGTSGQGVRHTARADPGRLAALALQPVEPRGLRPGRSAAPLTRSTGPHALMPLPIANVLQPIIDATDALMVFFHDQFGFSWGFSIIALTICVRALLLPLTIKQFRSMQALQRLQPEIKKLQAKYKDDKQRLNQEMMKFYGENKVNPLSSCLPIVAQLPIFFALFYMLRHDLRFDICGQTAKPCQEVIPDSAQFLFIPDLTDNATGAVLVVLIALYVGSQLASSVLMSTTA